MSPKPVFLFAFANDLAASLRLDEEWRQADRALQADEDAGRLKYTIIPYATRDDVWDKFNRFHNQITIFHYGGHSGSGGVNLTDSVLDGKNLAILLGQEQNLKLAFLNGCSNVGQVEILLEKGVPAVIATSAPINDRRAINLARQFYSALCSGRSVKEAFSIAAAYVNNEEKEVLLAYRGLEFRKGKKQFEWGLYAKEEAVLDWKIPSVAAITSLKLLRGLIILTVLVATFFLFKLLGSSSEAPVEDTSGQLIPYQDPSSELYGYKTESGKTVIPPQYEQAEAFANGRALVSKDQKFGYIDSSGTEVIQLQYGKAVSFSEGGEAEVELDGRNMTIDKEGKCLRNCLEEQRAEDQKAWIESLGKNSKAAFEAYRKQFPNGEYYSQAGEKIKSIEAAEQAMLAAKNDEQAWQLASGQYSIAAYQGYQNKYPKGKYFAEAARRIKKLEAEERKARNEQAWQVAERQNSIAGYKGYQQNFPQGMYFSEADRRINKLEEEQQSARDEQAWIDAEREGTVDALESYLKDFPNGTHITEAKKKIKAMKMFPYRICGKVTSAGGQPIKNVVVKISELALSSNTNEEGSFCLEGQRKFLEILKITFYKDGYKDNSRALPLSQGADSCIYTLKENIILKEIK